jgi:lipoate-protein ligase A
MLIVESNNLDVYHNLAMEEYLMVEVHECGPILFLWQSDCAVVMGKNQNPWRECRLNLMETDGVPLARRISGGGTVYHDGGNLNYCIITGREEYREEQAYGVVLDALALLGREGERTGKSNLSIGGYKFSGNAFAFRRGRAMHHGTLLLQTDLERLNRYLGSMYEQIETHAIASVPAAVANLDLPVEQVSAALIQAFRESYGTPNDVVIREVPFDDGMMEQRCAKQKSLDWIYGTTPRFTVQCNGFPVEVNKGIVAEVDGSAEHPLVGKTFYEAANSMLC